LSCGARRTRSSWRCSRRISRRRACGRQENCTAVPARLPGPACARNSHTCRRDHPTGPRRKGPRARPLRLVHHQVAVTSEPTPLPSPLPSPNQPEASSPLTNPTPCAVREGLSARMEQRVLANLGQLPWGGPPSPQLLPSSPSASSSERTLPFLNQRRCRKLRLEVNRIGTTASPAKLCTQRITAQETEADPARARRRPAVAQLDKGEDMEVLIKTGQ
jgi:hypothetical protein